MCVRKFEYCVNALLHQLHLEEKSCFPLVRSKLVVSSDCLEMRYQLLYVVASLKQGCNQMLHVGRAIGLLPSKNHSLLS